MSRVRVARVALLVLSFGLASTAAVAGVTAANPLDAAAASPHHAAVIVDTGTDVHKVLVTFTEDSISGIEALQRAGGNPVVYNFGGQGGAVCRIFGVGRDAGPGCLGGQDGDNRYWAYFRAPAGTSAFKYSSIGAGSARVHDGDVEGWKFGTGTAPAFVSLASLLPPPSPPPVAPPPSTAGDMAASPPAPGGLADRALPHGGAGTGAAGGSSRASTLPVTGGVADAAPRSAGAAAGSGAKSSKASGDREAGGRSLDTKLASADNGGSSAWSLLWVAALIAGIAAAVFVVRRARRRSA